MPGDWRRTARALALAYLVVVIVAVAVTVAVTHSFVYGVIGLLVSVCLLPFAGTAARARQHRTG